METDKKHCKSPGLYSFLDSLERNQNSEFPAIDVHMSYSPLEAGLGGDDPVVMDQSAVTQVCPLLDQSHVPGPVSVTGPRVCLQVTCLITCHTCRPLAALQTSTLHPHHQLAGALSHLETVSSLQRLQADILDLMYIYIVL